MFALRVAVRRTIDRKEVQSEVVGYRKGNIQNAISATVFREDCDTFLGRLSQNQLLGPR